MHDRSAYLYRLGAGGEPGVDHVLARFDAAVRRTMALVGARTAGHRTRDVIESVLR